MVSTRARKGEGSSQPPNQPPNKKVRNKVVSPVAKKRAVISKPEESGYSSDEFNYKDEEDETSVSASEASSTPSASGKQRSSLPHNLVRQLLIDIQQHGGIKVFQLQAPQALKELCDKNQKLYGTRGDPIRPRIRKKVQKWREKSEKDEADWLEVLEKYNVTEKPKGSRGLSLPTVSTPTRVDSPLPSVPPSIEVPFVASSAARTPKSAERPPTATVQVISVTSSVSVPSGQSVSSVVSTYSTKMASIDQAGKFDLPCQLTQINHSHGA